MHWHITPEAMHFLKILGRLFWLGASVICMMDGAGRLILHCTGFSYWEDFSDEWLLPRLYKLGKKFHFIYVYWEKWKFGGPRCKCVKCFGKVDDEGVAEAFEYEMTHPGFTDWSHRPGRAEPTMVEDTVNALTTTNAVIQGQNADTYYALDTLAPMPPTWQIDENGHLAATDENIDVGRAGA